MFVARNNRDNEALANLAKNSHTRIKVGFQLMYLFLLKENYSTKHNIWPVYTSRVYFWWLAWLTMGCLGVMSSLLLLWSVLVKVWPWLAMWASSTFWSVKVTNHAYHQILHIANSVEFHLLIRLMYNINWKTFTEHVISVKS